MEEVKMDVYVPITDIVKTKNADGDNWYVRGYASTPDRDFQGDIVDPAGINVEYFKKHGWINYEHQQSAEYVIGTPTECYIDNKGLYVEAKLFRDNKYAQDMWKLAQNIQKNDVDRKLGFSIEGTITKRDEVDERVIKEVKIRNVALTKNPANPEATWESFVAKTFTTGHEINPSEMEDGAALRRENLGQAITTLRQYGLFEDTAEAHRVWKDVAKYLDDSEKSDETSGVLLLQLATGVSRESAKNYLNREEIN